MMRRIGPLIGIAVVALSLVLFGDRRQRFLTAKRRCDPA